MTGQDRAERLFAAGAEADTAADAVRTLCRLLADQGLAPEAILAGAHAEIVAMMIVSLGGDVAGEAFRRAADRADQLPTLEELKLARATVAGRA